MLSTWSLKTLNSLPILSSSSINPSSLLSKSLVREDFLSPPFFFLASTKSKRFALYLLVDFQLRLDCYGMKLDLMRWFPSPCSSSPSHSLELEVKDSVLTVPLPNSLEIKESSLSKKWLPVQLQTTIPLTFCFSPYRPFSNLKFFFKF